MKILFTGGGTAGHFYPIIAVAEGVHDVVHEKKLIEPELYYAGPSRYDGDMLIANTITFVPTSAGKMRSYFSLLNFVDYFKTGWGIVRSVVRMFFLYPDVVFSKGGYASFPTLVAAHLFRIPVVIHESDAVPGRVNAWAGKFAEKIAVSFDEAAEYFPKDKVAYTGNPIRKSILRPEREGAYEFLKLERDVPIILIMGGSQGAAALNEAILAALPQLVEEYQIIHQTGDRNIEEMKGRAKVILGALPKSERYRPFGYLNDLALRMSVGAASLIISRAGSSIFEIAAWGLPSILVPLPADVAASDHQTKNAFAYAHTGACVVIEQANLKSGVIVSEIHRILHTKAIADAMSASAKKFARVDAAHTIAEALVDIGLSHEQ